jgi:hypothetical protein
MDFKVYREIKIPDNVYKNQHFQELRRVGIDVVLMYASTKSVIRSAADLT